MVLGKYRAVSFEGAIPRSRVAANPSEHRDRVARRGAEVTAFPEAVEGAAFRPVGYPAPPIPVMRLAFGGHSRGRLWPVCFSVVRLRSRPRGDMLGRVAAGGKALGEIPEPSCARKPGGGVCDNIAWFRK